MTRILTIILVGFLLAFAGSCPAVAQDKPDPVVSKTPIGLAHLTAVSTPELIALLNERRFAFRAAQILAERHATSAIPYLSALLVSPEVSLRVGAARAMADLGDRSGISVLRAALTDKDAYWPSAAAVHLAQLGDDSGRALLEKYLTSSSWVRRRAALNALDLLPHGLSVTAIAAALDDERPEVRQSAFWVATTKTSNVLRALLIEKTQSPDPDTRYQAVQALFTGNPRLNAEVAIGMLTDQDLLVRAKTALLIAHYSRVPVPRGRGQHGTAARARDLQQAYLEWLPANRDIAFPATGEPAGQPVKPAPPAP